MISVDIRSEGIGWPVTRTLGAVATNGPAGSGARPRFPDGRLWEGNPVRRLRYDPKRGVGERGVRPRYARLRRRVDSPVVEADGSASPPVRRDGLVHHRRRRRQQRLPGTGLETGTLSSSPMKKPPPRTRQSLPSGDQHANQDRASVVLSASPRTGAGNPSRPLRPVVRPHRPPRSARQGSGQGEARYANVSHGGPVSRAQMDTIALLPTRSMVRGTELLPRDSWQL